MTSKTTSNQGHDNNQEDQDCHDHPNHLHPPRHTARRFAVGPRAGIDVVGRVSHVCLLHAV